MDPRFLFAIWNQKLRIFLITASMLFASIIFLETKKHYVIGTLPFHPGPEFSTIAAEYHLGRLASFEHELQTLSVSQRTANTSRNSTNEFATFTAERQSNKLRKKLFFGPYFHLALEQQFEDQSGLNDIEQFRQKYFDYDIKTNSDSGAYWEINYKTIDRKVAETILTAAIALAQKDLNSDNRKDVKKIWDTRISNIETGIKVAYSKLAKEEKILTDNLVDEIRELEITVELGKNQKVLPEGRLRQSAIPMISFTSSQLALYKARLELLLVEQRDNEQRMQLARHEVKILQMSFNDYEENLSETTQEEFFDLIGEVPTTFRLAEYKQTVPKALIYMFVTVLSFCMSTFGLIFKELFLSTQHQPE